MSELPKCPVCGEGGFEYDPADGREGFNTIAGGCEHMFSMTDDEYRALCAAVERGKEKEQ